MPTFSTTSEYAREARESLHRLAGECQEVEDPAEIYRVLELMTECLHALAQSAHQLAKSHDEHLETRPRVSDLRGQHAAMHQVSWELHRAGEMLTQIGASVDRAHEIEATIAYGIHPVPTLLPTAHRHAERGMSL